MSISEKLKRKEKLDNFPTASGRREGGVKKEKDESRSDTIEKMRKGRVGQHDS